MNASFQPLENYLLQQDHKIQSSKIDKYVHLAKKEGMISFAAGMPDPSVLPIQSLKEAILQAKEEHPSTFQYQAPKASLKEKVQAIMASKSIPCDLDQILLTSGAQQAMYLSASLFYQQNAPLVIQEYVYPVYWQIAQLFNLELIPISSPPKQGIDFNQLESAFQRKNVLPYFYIVCNGHNPTGMTLDHDARKNLAYLAEKYGFLIVEDDPYGLLKLNQENDTLPMMAYTENAIYISSFSKIISPLLRTGWVVGNKKIVQKLAQLKDMNDLNIANINQVILNNLLEKNTLPDILTPQIALYQKKLDLMLSTLHQHMHAPFQYYKPKHGIFLWLELFNDSAEVYRDFIIENENLLYMSSADFSVKKQATWNAIRLNFSYPSFEQIEQGMQKLCRALSALMVQTM